MPRWHLRRDVGDQLYTSHGLWLHGSQGHMWKREVEWVLSKIPEAPEMFPMHFGGAKKSVRLRCMFS